jgi:hypothetical protein
MAIFNSLAELKNSVSLLDKAEEREVLISKKGEDFNIVPNEKSHIFQELG